MSWITLHGFFCCFSFSFSFFFTPIDNFLPPCENACSKREHRVPQHGEQMARPSRDGCLEEKTREREWKETHVLRLMLRSSRPQHTQSQWKWYRECALKSVYLCLLTCATLHVLVRSVYMLWCVWWDPRSSVGHRTNMHTGFCTADRREVAVLFQLLCA